jgi:hypothetical protein
LHFVLNAIKKGGEMLIDPIQLAFGAIIIVGSILIGVQLFKVFYSVRIIVEYPNEEQIETKGIEDEKRNV